MAKLIILGIFLKVTSFTQCLPIIDEATSNNKEKSDPNLPPPPADVASFIDTVPWGSKHIEPPHSANKDVNNQAGIPHHGVDTHGMVPPNAVGDGHSESIDPNNPFGLPQPAMDSHGMVPPNTVGDGQAGSVDPNNPFGLPHSAMDPHGMVPPNAAGDGHAGSDPNNPFGLPHSAMDPHGLGPLIDMGHAVGNGHSGNKDTNNPSVMQNLPMDPNGMGPPMGMVNSAGDGGSIDPNNPFGLPQSVMDPHGWGPPISMGHGVGDGHSGNVDANSPSGTSNQVIDPHGWGPFDMAHPVDDGQAGGVDANGPFMDPHGWGPPIDMIRTVADGHAVNSGEPVDLAQMVGSPTETNPFDNPWLAGLESSFFNIATGGATQTDQKGNKDNNIPPGIPHEVLNVHDSMTAGQEINSNPGMSHQLLDLPNTVIAGQEITNSGGISHQNLDVSKSVLSNKESGAPSGMSHQIIDVPNMLIGDPMDTSWGQPTHQQSHDIHNQNNGPVADHASVHPIPVHVNDVVHVDPGNQQQHHNVDHAIPVDTHLVHDNGNQVKDMSYAAPNADNQNVKLETTTCKNDNKVDQFLQSLISDAPVITNNGPLQDTKPVSTSDANYVADTPAIFPKIVRGPALGPPLPPMPFESTTTQAPYVGANSAVDNQEGSSGHHINTDLHGHGGHHAVNDRKCEGVVKDSTGKITHIVDKHDCSLLTVIDSHVTGGHVIDPHNNELLLAVESKSFLHPDNTGVQPHEVPHHPDNTGVHPHEGQHHPGNTGVLPNEGPQYADNADVLPHEGPHHLDNTGVLPKEVPQYVDNTGVLPHEGPLHPDIGVLPLVPVEKSPLTGTKANVLTSTDVQMIPEMKYEASKTDVKSGFTASELEEQVQQAKIQEKKQRLLEQQMIKQDQEKKRKLARQKAREEKARLRGVQRKKAQAKKARLLKEQRKQEQEKKRILARQKARKEKARLRAEQRKQKQEKRRRLQEEKRRQKQRRLEAREKRRRQRQLRREERARKKAEQRAKARKQRQLKKKQEQMKKNQKEAARRKKEAELKRKAASNYKPETKDVQVLKSEVTSDSSSVLDFLKQRQQSKQEMLRHYQG